jgi:hypothetical protein
MEQLLLDYHLLKINYKRWMIYLKECIESITKFGENQIELKACLVNHTVILTLGRLRQGDHEFKASYVDKPCVKNKLSKWQDWDGFLS